MRTIFDSINAAHNLTYPNMKKTLFAVTIVMMVVSAFSAQAAPKSKKSSGFDMSNVYAGGSVGFTSTSMSQPGGGGSTDGSSFKLMFDLGYDLNKVNSAGAEIGFFTGLASFGSADIVDISSLIKTAAGAAADLGLNDVTGFRFAPYIRHNIVSNKTFDVFVEGVLGFETAKTTVAVDDGMGNVVNQGEKATIIELIGRPGVAMKVAKNFKLISRIGAVGYQSVSTSQYQGNNSADGPKITRFGIDASTANMIFGIEYHF